MTEKKKAEEIERLKKVNRQLRSDLKKCRDGLRWHERNAIRDASRDRSWESQ